MIDAAGAAPDGTVPNPDDRKNAARAKRRRARNPEARAAAKREFLRAFSETLDVTKAARHIGRNPKTMYKWRQIDARFRARWAAIEAHFPDVLESTARRLALKGAKEDVFQNGKLVGTRRRLFPKLILELLRAEKPEKYRRSLIPSPEPAINPDEVCAKVRDMLRAMDASVAPPPPVAPSAGPDAAPTPATEPAKP